MGLAKPTGGYAEQMLAPDGWPDVDEDAFYDRARDYTRVLQQVTAVLENSQRQRGEIFDGGIWSGEAAGAAHRELGGIVDELIALQHGLATVISWQQHIGEAIVQAKSHIGENVEVAHTQITVLENDASLDADERTIAINTVVGAAHVANSGVVETTAEQILASKAWKPPDSALKDLLDQKTPPLVTLPGGPLPPVPSFPGGGHGEPPGEPGSTPAQPIPVFPRPGVPEQQPQTPPINNVPGVIPPGVIPPVSAPPTPGPQPGPPPGAGEPAPALPSGPGVGPKAPVAPDGPGEPAAPDGPEVPLAPAIPARPAASTDPGKTPAQPGDNGERGKGVAPAAVSGAPQSVASTVTDESSAATAPAAAAGMPGGVPPASSGAAAGRGAGSGAPVGQRPAGPQPSTRPAAARSKPKTWHGDRAEAEQHEPPAASAAAAAIPVSAARAARDAVADAAKAEAERRQGDPLRLARRVAAALNAPGNGGETDFGFFWVTGLTADGAIVVANSYGLAYLPEGVRLPDSVHMATADESIPAAERARWATYPIMAVQGWALARDTKLRAVIGTEEQLANSDAGAAKVVLQPDDIPETGDMAGRRRLQVVDPEAAERLDSTPDKSLPDLLPPALVDANPPADQRFELWFEAMKPMMSNVSGREIAHLRAFHTYIAHAQELALAAAHTATDPGGVRSAATDWLYWKHLNGLLDTALAATT